MPTRKPGESLSDWMSRCVSTQLNEGKPKDQAVAVCLNMHREKSESRFGEITKDLGEQVEIKADVQKRVVEAYASTFGNVDKVGDRVMSGAYKKTLQESFPKGNIKVCLNHDRTRPIGVPLHMEEDSKGLFTRSRIARTPLGDEALALIEDGVCTRMSIRAHVVKSAPGEDHPQFGKVTNLTELRLSEYGPVYWAANDEAAILTLKGLQDELLGTLLGVPGRVVALKAALSDATASDIAECSDLVTALKMAADELESLLKHGQPEPLSSTQAVDPEALKALQSEMEMFQLQLMAIR